VTHVRNRRTSRSPPRPHIVGRLSLDQLWNLLTDEQRQQTLATLSGIVLRQLDAPRGVQEVHDERS
jgi:hypothetical protein